MRLWRFDAEKKTHAQLAGLGGHSHWTVSCSFNSGGTLLASGALDGRVLLHECVGLDEWRLKQEVKGALGGVSCLSFSHSASPRAALQAGDEAGALSVWHLDAESTADVSSPRSAQFTSIECFSGVVHQCCFGPGLQQGSDSVSVASSIEDRCVGVWCMRTGAPIAFYTLAMVPDLCSLALHEAGNGRLVAYSSSGQTFHLHLDGMGKENKSSVSSQPQWHKKTTLVRTVPASVLVLSSCGDSQVNGMYNTIDGNRNKRPHWKHSTSELEVWWESGLWRIGTSATDLTRIGLDDQIWYINESDQKLPPEFEWQRAVSYSGSRLNAHVSCYQEAHERAPSCVIDDWKNAHYFACKYWERSAVPLSANRHWPREQDPYLPTTFENGAYHNTVKSSAPSVSFEQRLPPGEYEVQWRIKVTNQRHAYYEVPDLLFTATVDGFPAESMRKFVGRKTQIEQHGTG